MQPILHFGVCRFLGVEVVKWRFLGIDVRLESTLPMFLDLQQLLLSFELLVSVAFPPLFILVELLKRLIAGVRV